VRKKRSTFWRANLRQAPHYVTSDKGNVHRFVVGLKLPETVKARACPGSRATSDGGLLLVRELDERLGLCALIVENRQPAGEGTQLPLPELV
jgi:hypothetical protein